VSQQIVNNDYVANTDIIMLFLHKIIKNLCLCSTVCRSELTELVSCKQCGCTGAVSQHLSVECGKWLHHRTVWNATEWRKWLLFICFIHAIWFHSCPRKQSRFCSGIMVHSDTHCVWMGWVTLVTRCISV